MPLPIFSNYTVIRELGQGGMATVYLATHNTLGHHVAIKILDKQFAYNQNIKARFIEEAKKLVRLDHPNVVKVTDFISENEHVAYVMEYINGKSLRELLNAKRLTDAEIENYLNQMVVALNYIHKEGIVHRDIKPSNFIIATNGTLKLVDFGISKSIDASSVDHTSTSTNLSMGTLLYMSPEQIKSTKDVTYLSDIYSLGVVLWEMAMGKVPYNTSELSAFDIQVKIVQEKLPNTNTKWDEYIQIATSKEENQRVRFIDLLKNKHSNQTTNNNKTDKNEKTIIEPSNYKMPENPPKRNRKLFYFGISILLFSVIGFFYLLWPDELQRNKSNDLETKRLFGKVKSIIFDGDANRNPYRFDFDKKGNLIFSNFCKDAMNSGAFSPYEGEFLMSNNVDTPDEWRCVRYYKDKLKYDETIYEYEYSEGKLCSDLDIVKINNYKFYYENDRLKKEYYIEKDLKENDFFKRNSYYSYDEKGREISVKWDNEDSYSQKEYGFVNKWGVFVEYIKTFNYDLYGNKTAIWFTKDKNIYDHNNNVVKQIYYDFKNVEDYIYYYKYDENNNLIQKKFQSKKYKQNERIEIYRYDDFDNLIYQSYKGSFVDEYEYEYEYDDYHNWIKRTQKFKSGGELINNIIERKIIYYN